MYGMDDKHVAELIKLYQEVDTPSDSLIQDEDKLHTFCYRFEQRVGVAYKPKTIARALLTLRKSSRLPRLRRGVVQKRAGLRV